MKVSGWDGFNPPKESYPIKVQTLADHPSLTPSLDADNVIILTWTTYYATDDLTGFEIFRSTSINGPWDSLFLCMPYEDTAYDYFYEEGNEQQTYYYKIVAYNMQWVAGPPGPCNQHLDLYAPTRISGIVHTNPNVNELNWYDNSYCEDFYGIYRGTTTDPEEAELIDTIDGNGDSIASIQYFDTLTVSQTYYYWVLAYDSSTSTFSLLSGPQELTR